jgi:TPR repeat protein
LEGAKLGNANCMLILGVLHQSNSIKRASFKEAFKWISKAKESGSEDAAIYLAECISKASECPLAPPTPRGS